MTRIIVTLFVVLLAGSAWPQAKPLAVYVQINEKILPIARGDKYEDPLDSALKQKHLGEVTGAGTHLARDGSVEWVGLDVRLTNLESGISFLKEKLRELGAPRGSVITYEQFGKKIEVPVHDHDTTRPASAQPPQGRQ
jgi:hypothetical protein